MLRTFLNKYRICALWILIALLLPLVVRDEYYLMILTLCLIWAILASSLNLILGFTGQACLAQGAFFGIGAYANSLLMIKMNFSFWTALPAAIAITGIFGFLIGLVALRTSGAYFAICTMMFNIIVTTVIDRWESLTEGPRGVMGIPVPSGFGLIDFQSRTAFYYLALAGLLLTLLIVYQLMRSMIGKSFLAVRGNEELAQAVGINIRQSKVVSFTLSTMLAGLGGCLYASYLGFISPDASSFMVSFTALINVIIGGMATLSGPIVGTIIITFMMEYFQTFVEYATLMMGIVLLIFIIYLPGGIIWGLRRLNIYLQSHRKKGKLYAAT
jgi:branched-chain amino acid transport system permease protein